MWETTVMESCVDDQQINDSTFSRISGAISRFESERHRCLLSRTAFLPLTFSKLFDIMHPTNLPVASCQNLNTGTDNLRAAASIETKRI